MANSLPDATGYSQEPMVVYAVIRSSGGWGGTEVYHEVDGVFTTAAAAQAHIDAEYPKEVNRRALAAYEIQETSLFECATDSAPAHSADSRAQRNDLSDFASFRC